MAHENKTKSKVYAHQAAGGKVGGGQVLFLVSSIMSIMGTVLFIQYNSANEVSPCFFTNMPEYLQAHLFKGHL